MGGVAIGGDGVDALGRKRGWIGAIAVLEDPDSTLFSGGVGGDVVGGKRVCCIRWRWCISFVCFFLIFLPFSLTSFHGQVIGDAIEMRTGQAMEEWRMQRTGR